MAAGIATLTELKNPDFYNMINEKSEYLAQGLIKEAADAEIDVSVKKVGGNAGALFYGHRCEKL